MAENASFATVAKDTIGIFRQWPMPVPTYYSSPFPTSCLLEFKPATQFPLFDSQPRLETLLCEESTVDAGT